MKKVMKDIFLKLILIYNLPFLLERTKGEEAEKLVTIFPYKTEHFIHIRILK